MPLLKGSNPDIISANIKELRNTGKYSQNQCVAIAMKHANKSKTASRVSKKVNAKSRMKVKVK